MLALVVVVVTRSSSYVALALVADERMSRLEEKVEELSGSVPDLVRVLTGQSKETTAPEPG